MPWVHLLALRFMPALSVARTVTQELDFVATCDAAVGHIVTELLWCLHHHLSRWMLATATAWPALVQATYTHPLQCVFFYYHTTTFSFSLALSGALDSNKGWVQVTLPFSS